MGRADESTEVFRKTDPPPSPDEVQIQCLAGQVPGACTAILVRLAEGQDAILRTARLAALANANPGDALKPWMIPEPLRWVGAAINPVRADNLRLDWASVTAPELFYHGRHVTELSWMHWEEIAETYGLSLEEARRRSSVL